LVVRVLLLMTCLACLAPASWADGKKPKTGEGSTTQEYAVVAGTVFRDNGFALAEAEVTLEIDASATGKSRARKLKATTSPRGEFAFRVPPAAMKYRVTVTAKGFRIAEKVVEVQGSSERVDATFNLSPESKH
jgi:hypothetical protein